MTIEFLYPELCNLYGDRGNMDYLRRCLPADTRQTYMGDEPWFVQHEVDLIYMCSMTERSQEAYYSGAGTLPGAPEGPDGRGRISFLQATPWRCSARPSGMGKRPSRAWACWI